MEHRIEDVTLPDAGDIDAALDDFYTRFGPLAYGLAVGIVRDGAAAEEIVCAAFVETWVGAMDRGAPAPATRRHLLAAVHRRAAEFVRASYPRPQHRLPQPGLLPDWLALERETAWGLLCQLPGTERDVIELAYFGCFTLIEIATRLDLRVDTVRADLSAGLGRLRELERGALEDAALSKRRLPAWRLPWRVFGQARVRGIR